MRGREGCGWGASPGSDPPCASPQSLVAVTLSCLFGLQGIRLAALPTAQCAPPSGGSPHLCSISCRFSLPPHIHRLLQCNMAGPTHVLQQAIRRFEEAAGGSSSAASFIAAPSFKGGQPGYFFSKGPSGKSRQFEGVLPRSAKCTASSFGLLPTGLTHAVGQLVSPPVCCRKSRR